MWNVASCWFKPIAWVHKDERASMRQDWTPPTPIAIRER